MKNSLLSLLLCFTTGALFAQGNTDLDVKKANLEIRNRAKDHLMLQFGFTGWQNAPDSAKSDGFSKSINAYFMFDFPFKNNPKLSIGIGPGISSDHIIFKKKHIGIKDRVETMPFTDMSDKDHYKKTKLGTVYAEAPIEFRYTANPYQADKSFKAAIGVKVGTMLNAKTRNVKYESATGSLINDAVVKEKSKQFFNNNRLVATARIGWGHFSLYGSYQLTNLFKDGAGPEVRPFSIGLTLSGL